MGRGKWDNCSNCVFGTESRTERKKYTCKFDKKNEYEEDYWCKYHENEDEQG